MSSSQYKVKGRKGTLRCLSLCPRGRVGDLYENLQRGSAPTLSSIDAYRALHSCARLHHLVLVDNQSCLPQRWLNFIDEETSHKEAF